MKLNNFQKNFYIFFSVIISILVVTLLWEKINLPLDNTSDTKGALISKNYNPTNDTLRYIFFIGLPLTVYFFLNLIINERNISIRELIFEKDEKQDSLFELVSGKLAALLSYWYFSNETTKQDFDKIINDIDNPS